MKIKIIITLCAGFFLVTACPEKSPKSALELIQENNMDLPKPLGYYHKGINFKLSELFMRLNFNDMVIQDDADVRVIPELYLYFTVESFSRSEAEAFQYAFEEEIDELDAVHDAYLGKRLSTLDESNVSIKKAVPSSVKYPGYIQVISGSEFKNEDPLTYFMATLQINSKFYVLQLIGKKENMGYLHDDFIEIISSVE
ncbi:MAG: hypothetical protein HRT57_02295 [Crocinitomicaceae bacterium]|nr:hypothetical protein [Crocinitomicaceae bacterium]